MHAHLPAPARLPPSLPPPADLVACARLAGDGDDGADPAADRRLGQRDQSPPPRRPPAPAPRPARGGSAEARPHRGPAADRREGLAGGGVRSPPGLLRASAEARARLL